jgi:2-polyprenyl-3-methyl-5-hydroxy-6-metoxy-1,4-benzoquinol methylase
MKNILDKHIKAYQGQNLYDFDNNIQLNWYPKRILEHANNAKSIMELGVGHGITTNIFSKHFSRHVVLDASSAVIGNFRKKFPDCEAQIIETFFEDYKTEEKFDVIVLGFILEHVDNPSEILVYYKKFLAPEGKMFVTVPNAEVLNRKLGYIAGLLPDMQDLSEHDRLCGHKRYYTVASLTEEVRSSGYEIEHMEGIYLKPFTTRQMISLNFDKKILDALCKVGMDYPELCCGILAELKAV